jgi:hypothetical protein
VLEKIMLKRIKLKLKKKKKGILKFKKPGETEGVKGEEQQQNEGS